MAVLACAWIGAAADRGFVTGQAAVSVVGQKTFSANVPGTSTTELGTVTGLAVAGERLIVGDGFLPFGAPNNNRVLIFPSVPQFTSGGTASVVIGQEDFTKNAAGVSDKAFDRPMGVSTDGQRLAVADFGNNRVLIFNQIPTTNGVAANVVVGQPDFTSRTPNATDAGLRGPNNVFLDGQRLFIADTLSHRVLIYSSVPTSNGARANIVLGQPDFTKADQLAPTQSSLRDPTGVFSDGTRLIITDLGHNRVLIWNRIPTANNAPADVVVGQPNFTTEAAGTTPASLNFPRFAFTDGTRLYIADTGNNRVLVYNQIPTTNGAAADAALGQRDFITGSDPTLFDPQQLSPALLGFPVALAPRDGGVLVADSVNRRVLKFIPGQQLSVPGAIVNAASFSGNGIGRPHNVQVEVKDVGTDEASLPAGTYFIKVTAEGGILFESVPSEEVVVTIPEKKKLRVTWDKVDAATAYRIYLGGSPGGQTRYFTTATPAAGEEIKRDVEINTLFLAEAGGPRLEITPGGVTVLFGRELAPSEAWAMDLPLPTELAGVSLLINGVPAPLFYVSPTQINFQVPWEVTGRSASLVIQKKLETGEVLLSNAIPAPVSDLTPGVFTTSGTGVGRLLAFHADFTPVDEAHPLMPGEDIIFFATGVQSVNFQGTALAAATFDAVTKGTLTANSSGTVTWSIQLSSSARVYVSADGGADTLMSEGKEGTQQASFVTPGHIFRFTLRALDGTEEGPVVATALVDTRPGAVTGTPAGQISVDGNTVNWSSSNTPSARVYTSIDGAPPFVFAEGTQGSKAADFFESGHFYKFSLRQVVSGIDGATLGEAIVERFVAPTTGATGTLSVDSAGKITWSTTNADNARVHVSINGAAENSYADGKSGEKTPDFGFIKAGRIYRFILRVPRTEPPASSGAASPANATIQTTMSVSIQGKDAPIQFGGLAPGLVGLLQFNVRVADDLELNGQDAEVKLFVGSIPANLTYLPVYKVPATGTITVVQENGKWVVKWTTEHTATARVYVTVDGGEPVLMGESATGNQSADWIVAGHIYKFTLKAFENGQEGAVLAETTLDTRN